VQEKYRKPVFGMVKDMEVEFARRKRGEHDKKEKAGEDGRTTYHYHGKH